jgi:hypothetical protein
VAEAWVEAGVGHGSTVGPRGGSGMEIA